MKKPRFNFFYPSWKVFVLPAVWAIIIITYAILNPITSNEFVVNMEEVEGTGQLTAAQEVLTVKTVYFTARSIIITGIILYILSCALFHLYSTYSRR